MFGSTSGVLISTATSTTFGPVMVVIGRILLVVVKMSALLDQGCCSNNVVCVQVDKTASDIVGPMLLCRGWQYWVNKRLVQWQLYSFVHV